MPWLPTSISLFTGAPLRPSVPRVRREGRGGGVCPVKRWWGKATESRQAYGEMAWALGAQEGSLLA